jgi:hypothetical protein
MHNYVTEGGNTLILFQQVDPHKFIILSVSAYVG